VRLLLDEQYSPIIATQLSADAYDVLPVQGTALAGQSDGSLLEAAVSQQRSLVTNNVRDFAPIAAEWAALGLAHYGLIFASDSTIPRSRNTIGIFVDALRRLLDEYPEPAALHNRVHWLQRTTSP